MYISGAITALGTPLTDNEDLHREGMRKQVRVQVEAGINGLLVLGSMGAAQLLKEEVCREALNVVRTEVSNEVPVIAGCGDTSTSRTVERVRWAREAGVDAVAVISPYFFKFSQSELIDHFRTVAESTDLPIYLYNLPATTGHSLTYETIEELAQVSNIIGIKESGDLNNVRLCSSELQSTRNFNVLSGLSKFPEVAMRLGADGIIDGLFAIAPALAVEFINALHQESASQLREASRRIERLAEVATVNSVFGGFSAAMNIRGMPGNYAPRPFTRQTPEGERKVARILEGLGLA